MDFHVETIPICLSFSASVDLPAPILPMTQIKLNIKN
jgi:hypothetical protein